MGFTTLELQKIEDLVFEKKKDENSAIISILGETCELQFYQGVFTFLKYIASIKTIDAHSIAQVSNCLTVLNGGLSIAHALLTCIDDQISLVMVLEEDEILNVKIHDRIIHFMCLARCLDEVFITHSI